MINPLTTLPNTQLWQPKPIFYFIWGLMPERGDRCVTELGTSFPALRTSYAASRSDFSYHRVIKIWNASLFWSAQKIFDSLAGHTYTNIGATAGSLPIFFEEGRMSWFYIWFYMWNCDSDRTFVCTTTCLVMTYTVTWTYSATLSLVCIMASPFSGLRNTCKTFPHCFYTDVRHQGTFQKDIGGQFTRQHKVIV